MASARSLSEFQKAFSDEASCVAFLFKRRWPDGFVCPGCGKRRAALLKSRPGCIVGKMAGHVATAAFASVVFCAFYLGLAQAS